MLYDLIINIIKDKKMTAPMPREHSKEMNHVTDLLQTVQLNNNLSLIFMNHIDIHQKDRFGNTALYWAIYHHNMHNVKTLLYYGCTLDVTSDAKKAPFCAVDAHNLEALRYLVDEGMDIFMEYQGESLIEYAERLGSNEIKEYFKKLSFMRCRR